MSFLDPSDEHAVRWAVTEAMRRFDRGDFSPYSLDRLVDALVAEKSWHADSITWRTLAAMAEERPRESRAAECAAAATVVARVRAQLGQA